VALSRSIGLARGRSSGTAGQLGLGARGTICRGVWAQRPRLARGSHRPSICGKRRNPL